MIDKLFLIKEIKSKTGVVHFKRYRLLNLYFFKICLHFIYERDKDDYLHDHPWNYIIIPLKGSYKEKTVNGINIIKFGQIHFKRAEHLHAINEIISPTITLAILGRSKRVWGYQTDNGWVNHIEYRKNKKL